MVKQRGVPNSYSGDAVNIAVYVPNRCLTRWIKNVVPKEVWSGKKSSVHHFIWFGGLCYKYVPDSKKRKSGDKSEVMILVGHHATDAYKLYDPATQNMSIGRDMVINEGSSWNWQLRSNSSKPHISSLLSDNDNYDESWWRSRNTKC